MPSNLDAYGDKFWEDYHQSLLGLLKVDYVRFMYQHSDADMIMADGRNFFEITMYWSVDGSRYHAYETVEMDDLYIKRNNFGGWFQVEPFWYDLRSTERINTLRYLIEKSKLAESINDM